MIILAPVLFMLDMWRWQAALPVAGLSIVGGILQLSCDNRSDMKYLMKTKRLKQACISKDFQQLGKSRS